MSILQNYKDASGFKTYPKPLTDHLFAGLSGYENIDFKIWLGLIGEDEIKIADDQALEIYFVKAFKDQRAERAQFWNPAQKASHISFWFLQAEAERVCAGLRHGCKFWQLVDWVPTQKELDELVQNKPVPQKKKPTQAAVVTEKPKKVIKTKEKPIRDEWTLDLFGGVA